mmetsp:Transcript_10478/g.20703  ORF Transcript_10478/g.20703 Transcript_10478/m.20703 type:complete len:111 (-) Transcript_10478:237-569(-)
MSNWNLIVLTSFNESQMVARQVARLGGVREPLPRLACLFFCGMRVHSISESTRKKILPNIRSLTSHLHVAARGTCLIHQCQLKTVFYIYIASLFRAFKKASDGRSVVTIL